LRQSAARKAGILLVSRNTAVLLLSLALLNGLVASRLLVECLPLDGSSLVELIGQDPCHHLFGGHVHKSCPTSLGENDPSDPCVDLIMDNFGVTQSAALLQFSPTLITDLPAQAAQAGENFIQAPTAGGIFKPAREPARIPNCDPHLNTCIRI